MPLDEVIASEEAIRTDSMRILIPDMERLAADDGDPVGGREQAVVAPQAVLQQVTLDVDCLVAHRVDLPLCGPEVSRWCE